VNTTLVVVAVVTGSLVLLCYLTFLAIDWFLDAEYRAIRQWLDNYKKQIEDDK